MSNKPDTYSFLPWLREGIANQTATDPDIDKLRAILNVGFSIQGSGIGENKPDADIAGSIRLYGPGDVVGIDRKNVIKTEPRDQITNFEPNYLPSIDFYDEDFPWRYSPVQPDEHGRLRPWLALIVLEEDVFENGKDMTNKPLPYIVLKEGIEPVNVFQPSGELWAWAHVHVNRDLITNDDPDIEVPPDLSGVETVKADASEMESVLSRFEEVRGQDPDMAYSRVICPIKLKENTSYHAFLVPAFESGRLAGLGLDVEDIFENNDYTPYTPAWASQVDETLQRVEAQKFPVYYRWHFRTGKVGDFEYLVRLLEPQPVDSRVGRRDMDVTRPGVYIDGISDDELKPDGDKYPSLNGVLRLGGVLRIPEINISGEDRETYEKYKNWDVPYPRKFQKELASFINLSEKFSKQGVKNSLSDPHLPTKIKQLGTESSDPDPLITPPLYGRWHALNTELLKEGDGIPDNNWVHRLNLDPRYRVAAGFGTKIIQTHQEEYMESAWQQVGEVVEANRRIREARLAQFAARRWYNKYLKPIRNVDSGAFLWLTQPLQSRVVSKAGADNEEATTVKHQVKTGKVPPVVFSYSMRKFSRPGSRLVQALGLQSSSQKASGLIEKINNSEVLTAPPKEVPEGIATTSVMEDSFLPQKVPAFLLRWIEKYKWFKYLVLAVALIILILLSVFVAPGLSSITPGLGSVSGAALLIALLLIYLFLSIRKWEKNMSASRMFDTEKQTPEAIDESPQKPDFRLTNYGDFTHFSVGDSDSDESARFKTALREVNVLLQDFLDAVRGSEQYRPPLKLDVISDAILEKTDPDITIPGYILQARVSLPPRLVAEFKKEVFREAMAYPEFDIPMYKPLLDFSSDMFLPNINYVAQNSISLLEVNQPFIEAYMTGLNHEFARELLWREYPTDQRGSYFRQFWDVSDFMYEKEELNAFYNNAKAHLGEDADEKEIKAFIADEIRESLKDIPKLHLWSKFSNLGDHDHREAYKKQKLSETLQSGDVGDKTEVVLVIRGELLKRYPNAVIYAHKAKWKYDDEGNIDNTESRLLMELETEELNNPPRTKVKTPLYEAKAEPDIYFFGFDLDADTAKGGTGEDGETEPGWFFVIKERPGEPRFGLDAGETVPEKLTFWNDLTWGSIAGSGDDSASNFIRIVEDMPSFSITGDDPEGEKDEVRRQHFEDKQIEWCNGEGCRINSSDLAYILYQAPVMMAVHGSEMLRKI
jgi:hypothetical protein